MNIIEAIKSGKRIKRKTWPTFDFYHNIYAECRVPPEDILSFDWQIEVSVPITRAQFFEAYAHAVGELPTNATTGMLFEMVANRLGL